MAYRGTTKYDAAIAITCGIACHTLFVIGVGAMMAAMFFGMSRCLGRLASPWGGLADAALLFQFPVVHSALLSRPGRRWMSRLAPSGLGGRLSTTTYATIASVQVGLLFALWTPSRIIWWQA